MAQELSLLEKRKRKEWLEKLYDVTSRMCIKYGSLGNTSGKKEAQPNILRIGDHLKEFWPEDDRPSMDYIRKNIKVNDLKWYIHNKIEVNNKIWTPDFLFGVAKHGEISWSKTSFPSLSWTNNKNMRTVIKTATFGGKISKESEVQHRINYWSQVPALYLKHSEKSIEFMAGLLSCGNLVEKDGVSYARYAGRTIQYLEEWHIPIEIKTDYDKRENYVLISPIWAALFTPKMPKEITETWLTVENPCNSKTYCPILWKTYVGNFVKDGIPYLPSRRAIYYHHKCDEGAIHKLDQLRISTGMVELDYRVRDMVKIWSTKLQNKYND